MDLSLFFQGDFPEFFKGFFLFLSKKLDLLEIQRHSTLVKIEWALINKENSKWKDLPDGGLFYFD